jgi:N-acetylglutamate synthase-like GNAT family acetyltransferase
MGVIKFLLRKGNERDRTAVHDLLVSYEMAADLPPNEFIVAEIEGQIVGAARLEWEDQAAYVRPILVHSAWRGKNIGVALIRTIAQHQPALHVVARGSATGFYRKLGFMPMPWDQVPERYRQECETCPALETCRPEPMRETGSL